MDLIAIIRIRGKIKVKSEINDTMSMLNLNTNNNCSIFKSNDSILGMLNKAKDFITWGKIDKDTLKSLLLKRGRLVGDKRIDDEFLSNNKLDVDKMVDMFVHDPNDLYKLGLKKSFRLTPPSKGFERNGIKETYALGGVLGDRREKINELLSKMI